MGNTQLPCYQRFSFIDPSQKHVTEIERPDPVVDLLEADAVLPQSRRQIQQPGREANGPRVGDALDHEVVRVSSAGITPAYGRGETR